MRRALVMAARGRGTTTPNPLVGAVVVRGGKILAEGFHRRPGEPHAEVQALAKLGGRAPGATVYVNLEPCAHLGRTGPCADAVRAAGVSRVVVGVRDPNPLVNGRGIQRLRRAGIRVDVGCLEAESRAINRSFFVWIRDRRPLVTLKVAASLDGIIADRAPRARAAPVWITGDEARAAAHRLRAEHDAILVGAGTVRADDPLLTVRGPAALRRRSRLRWRVVVDARLAISRRARVLAPAVGLRTLVIGAAGVERSRMRALEAAGAEVALLPAGRDARIPMAAILKALAARDIQSLLVEGGAEVHGQLIAHGLVDRVAFFIAPRLVGGGIPVAAGAGLSMARALRLGPLTVRRAGADLCVEADVLP
jgi:diaminohydroxyphosphoribosylaminopyrimidine deaminase/5-amino-6-(5-phosphoribosylamino)uracil reductase